MLILTIFTILVRMVKMIMGMDMYMAKVIEKDLGTVTVKETDTTILKVTITKKKQIHLATTCIRHFLKPILDMESAMVITMGIFSNNHLKINIAMNKVTMKDMSLIAISRKRKLMMSKMIYLNHTSSIQISILTK